MDKIKDWVLDNIAIVYAAIMIALFVVLLMSAPKPEPPTQQHHTHTRWV